MTALVDNVLSYQRLDAGAERLDRRVALLDGVVTAGIDAAVELIGPGRAQFAVHAPPIEAEVDAARLATALAHLVADVAGVDATGRNRATAPGAAPADSTIVVAAAQRGTSYASRSAARTRAATRSTGPSCAASWQRTAVSCRPMRCRGRPAARTSSKSRSAPAGALCPLRRRGPRHRPVAAARSSRCPRRPASPS